MIGGNKNRYSAQQKLERVNGGHEYFDYLHRMIDGAVHSIHIQMYIFSYDETGKMVVDWLKGAAKRGVKIYILVDGYATKLPLELLNIFSETTIYIKRFEPLLMTRSFYFGRRLHHKIVVADDGKALVGSNNINNHYYGLHNSRAWLDMALYLEGTVARELEQICVQLWNSTKPDDVHADLSTPVPINKEGNESNISVKVSRNDWRQNRQEIWKSYFNIINKANSNVLLVSSYFLPGKRLRKQMRLARAKGISIKIITAGLSDVKIAKYAERYLYAWLLRNNIEIYEYQPSILHAKLGIRDGKWLTLGSFNINDISTYASIELNLNVRNQPFVSSIEQQLNKIMTEDCIRITVENFDKKQTFLQRIIQRFSYNLIRVLLFLFTFYFKKEKWQ
ncbi:MAG: phosphatidylserine/phosphatidylglycerophosphate/cardiolipin synthase family protein [Taibaiella sp.]|jgi:cardiolipin synthase